MRAIATSTPGDLHALGPMDVPTPAPAPGQVRVTVHASSVNPADSKIVHWTSQARFLHARVSPLIPGYDLAGVVDAVGAGVADLAVGDRVFGHLPFSGKSKAGAWAEQAVIAASELGRLPADVDFSPAGAIPTVGLTALQGLRDAGGLKPGGRVLLFGAAGGVGALAIGIAKRLGAHVTAVCSTYAVDFVRDLGADVVVDRATADPLAHDTPFDVILDASGAYSYGQCVPILSKSGSFVTTLPSLAFATGKLRSLFSGRTCTFVVVKSRRADLDLLGAWLADGLVVPVDERYAIRNAPAAIARIDGGGLLGKIALDVADAW
ncbi:MAG: NAD(P)-dependent alcohol dehydrogenase [bacterium]